MIKVEVLRKKDSTMLYFETNNTSPDGLDSFDEAYQALLGSGLKRGGYLDSNRFEIEVKDIAD